MSEETPPVARMEAAGRNPGNAGETGTPDFAALHPGYGAETQIAQLGDVAHFEMGQSPPSKHVRELDRGLPFLQGNAEFGAIFPAAKLECDAPGKVCDAGDILISVRAPVGALNKADKSYCIGRGLAAVSFNNVDSGFGWHMLNYWSPRLRVVAQGTTFEAVGRKELQQLQIQLFSVHEQRRIAEILDTLDDAIQKTEQLIAKLKQIKQGLLHDLLTRGIDENGQLRDPIAHPEQFKDSVLGRIPREWTVKLLGEACSEGDGSIQTGPFGSQLHAEDYKREGVPIITVEHLGDEKILHHNLPLVGEYDYKRLSRYVLATGDLVFSRVGAIDRCSYVSEQENGWLFSGRCLRVRVGSGVFYHRFMLYQLNSHAARQWILNNSVGSTMACLNTTILSRLPVFIPSIEEQKHIASILDAHGKRISYEGCYLNKLLAIKKALMHDLLTGKVRVTSISGERYV